MGFNASRGMVPLTFVIGSVWVGVGVLTVIGFRLAGRSTELALES